MTETAKGRVTDRDLREALLEEKKRLLNEHREEIIKRAAKRLKEKIGPK